MREDELREHAQCSICKQDIAHPGLPLFWVVEAARHGVKAEPVMRQVGLTGVLGGHAALARVMGPDEDMTQEVNRFKVTVCESCAASHTFTLYDLWSMHGDGEGDGECQTCHGDQSLQPCPTCGQE